MWYTECWFSVSHIVSGISKRNLWYVWDLFPLGLPLIGTILRVLQYHSEGKHDSASKEDTSDEELQALAEITAEFLADICIQIPKVKPKEPFFVLLPPNPVFLLDQIAKEVSNHSGFFFVFFTLCRTLWQIWWRKATLQRRLLSQPQAV